MSKHQHYLWSEIHEWLRHVHRDQPEFHRELLTRASLLCEGHAGGIALDPDHSVSWIGRDLTLDKVLEWEEQGYGLLAPDAPWRCHCPAGEEFLPVMAVPYRQGEQLTLTLVLIRNAGSEPFAREDELNANRLIQEAMSTMDKNTLLEELASSNAALRQRQDEQDELIRELKQARDQLMQSEKMASIGQLAAGVAHEINNPIGYVRSNLSSLREYTESLLALNDAFAEALGEKFQSPELQSLCRSHDLEFIREDLPSLLDESRDGIERVEKIIRSLRDFSRTDTGEMESLDIHQCLNKALAVARNEIKYRATVETDFAELPAITGVDSQLGQVFLNLLVNAAQAIEEQGLITISTAHRDADHIEVRIADTGKGVDPDNLDRLFEPFFTTKPVGKGTGLGLSLSYGIVQSHQGELSVSSTPGEGTTFRVVLPVQQAASGAAE
ncbi:PAS domain-containing sensor histidine kinase [Halovibrio salipaludis]|uniref:histidine kinase n=1 Tax=Halovibrio salipaludis TaxID=2032626 RepID=A0A2A2FAQ4_9GAMM|nr:ATP-binding protein [Halovibrio salipaludis]PAU81767.1 PAS domain-containing sensor histidine kinase [Halovibrio salipaludis]